MPKQSYSPKGIKGSSRPADFEDSKGKENRQSKRPGKGDFDRYRRAKNESFKQDSTWYIKDSQLRKDLGSLPFSIMGGVTVTEQGVNVAQATLTAIPWNPALPHDKNGSNGSTLAARMLYTFVRHQNSGHTNYDAPDLFIYVYSYIWTLSWVEHLHRLYRIFNTYILCNKAVPNHLLAAYGLGTTNANLIRSRIASFRARLNMALYRLSSFAIPRGFTLIDRWLFLNSNVFKDGDDEHAQMYMYVPNNVWQVYENWVATGATWTGTVFAPYETANLDELITYTGIADPVDAIFNELDLMIDQFAASEDFNIMSGDILKAFGEEGIIKLKSVAEDEVIVFNRDEAALNQIKHGIYDTKLSAGPVVQDPEGVVFQLIRMSGATLSAAAAVAPTMSNIMGSLEQPGSNRYAAFTFADNAARGTWVTGGCPDIISAYGVSESVTNTQVMTLGKAFLIFKDVPQDEGMVIDATRNMRLAEYKSITYGGSTLKVINHATYGSEIFSRLVIYKTSDTFGPSYGRTQHSGFDTDNTGFNLTDLFTDFAWFPIIYKITLSAASDGITTINDVYVDKNKMQLVHYDYLNNVNRQSFMGLLVVPLIAKYTGLE